MPKRGFAFIFLAAILWGTTGTSQALAPTGAQPLAIGALRLMIGSAALAVMLYFRKNSQNPISKIRLPVHGIFLAAACMAAYQVLFFGGVARTGVAIGTIAGIGSSPVLAGILGWVFRGERPGWNWVVATILAISGCSLLALAGGEIQVDLFGLLMAIGAGGAYATFSLVSKGLLEHQPVEVVMTAAFGLGALMLAPLLFWQDLSWVWTVRGAVVILHLGLFATALAYILYGKGLSLVPVASAVTISLAEPLTAGILGVTILGERLTAPAGIGILLIMCGLILLSIQKNVPGKKLPTP